MPRSEKTPLSPAQRRAVPLLAIGLSNKEVAKIVGVAAPTISAWFKQRKFLAALDAMREKHDIALEESLLAGEKEAIATMVAALRAEDEGSPNWTIRLRAAERLLDSAGRRGKPVERVEQFSQTITGDVGEMLERALRDPGVRARLLERGFDQLPEATEAEYEVLPPLEEGEHDG